MTIYMSGFANHFETEAIEGALPVGQNNPQCCKFDLYAEQISGTAFTAPRERNARTWFYRIRPSVRHLAKNVRYDLPHWKAAPQAWPEDLELGVYRWDALPENPDADFLSGMRTMTLAGDAGSLDGMAAHSFALGKDMTDTYAVNADGEMMIIPQAGALVIRTEMGVMHVEPGEIAVVPRGVIYQIAKAMGSGFARGYVCENYGSRFALPERGPIGANGLANERDFLTPVAAYETRDEHCELITKWGGRFYRCELPHSPLDVVAWHGNYVPYKYDLRKFNVMGSISYDHPDPSIFTVLTSSSSVAGNANVDFAIFPPRWMVAEGTFRPPWYHRNIMSEFMGLIYGEYDAKPDGFRPGGMSLHTMMMPHGPDLNAFEKASHADLKPEKLDHTMAFMFETRLPQIITEFAASTDCRQKNYLDCWDGLNPAKV